MFEYESRNRNHHFFKLDILDNMKILRSCLKMEFQKTICGKVDKKAIA